MPIDGRTDMHNEADIRFRNFAIKIFSYNVNKNVYTGNVQEC